MPNRVSKPTPPAIMFSVDINEIETLEYEDTYKKIIEYSNTAMLSTTCKI